MRKERGITLIGLIVTIIILLILAGISIASLGGENGLFSRVKQARKAQIESEMKEQLSIALSELQLEKKGKATLDDMTQEWADNKLKEYEPIITNDASTSGKKITMSKNGIVGKYLIDEKLGITEIENSNSTVEFSYDAGERIDNKVNVVIHVRDRENGLTKIEFTDIEPVTANGTKEEITIDYSVEIGTQYKIKITSENGQVTEEIILISDYWYNITKDLGEGISIDNIAVKAAYNKLYQAILTTENDYILDTISVTMSGEEITVDKTAGAINIENVTGDIKIVATTKKLEIQTTTPIINTTSTATSSLGTNTQTKGKTLYINFTATLNVEGGTCTVEPEVPYAITANAIYTFKITGIYGNKTATKEIEITVDQYQSAQGLVQYDAGDWTKEEINGLKTIKLYDLNASHAVGATFKLNDDNGLNFTFGGFTYKGDTSNESTDGVITSRNKSVSPYSGYGTPKYDGWQLLDTETKTDESGNIIKNEDGTNRIYVKTIVHAGTPENFVYRWTGEIDSYRAEYLLTGIANYGDTYKTLSDGTPINPRSWDVYRDKELDAKEYIKDVHAMTYNEAYSITNSVNATTEVRNIGSYYWLGNAKYGSQRNVLCN